MKIQTKNQNGKKDKERKNTKNEDKEKKYSKNIEDDIEEEIIIDRSKNPPCGTRPKYERGCKKNLSTKF